MVHLAAIYIYILILWLLTDYMYAQVRATTYAHAYRNVAATPHNVIQLTAWDCVRCHNYHEKLFNFIKLPLKKSNFMKLFESTPEEGTYYPVKEHFNYNGLGTRYNIIL